MKKSQIRFSRVVMYIFVVLIVAEGSYGAEFDSFDRLVLRPSGVFLTPGLQRTVFDTSHPGVVENRHERRRVKTDREKRELAADQISYGYLHGIVLGAIFAVAGRSVHKNGAYIGGGFGMALGSAGAVYAIGENHSDFDRDNVLELPLFRVVDGGRLGLATFGGALLGIGVFSPITGTIAYRVFKPKAPALVQLESGRIQYSLPTISIQESRLSPYQPEADFTVRLMRVQF